jgi:hypothetical protein
MDAVGRDNRAIVTQEVIEELIKLAKEIDAATKAGRVMRFTDERKSILRFSCSKRERGDGDGQR